MDTCNSKFKIQNAKGDGPATRQWRLLVVLHFAFCILHFPSLATAQTPPTITEVRVEQEGQPVTDPQILGLLETTVGESLSVADVRESIRHLSSLNRYDDVQVFDEPVANG